MTITYRDQQDRDLTPAEVDANFRHVLDSSNSTFVQSGSGATSLTVQQALRVWYTPDQFGAVGDGSTNDRAALQLMFDAIKAAGGGVIYLPYGKSYAITGNSDKGVELTEGSNITIMGPGTFKRSSASATNQAWITFNNCDNIEIHGGVTFDYNNMATFGGLKFYGGDNNRVHHCRFIDSNYNSSTTSDRYAILVATDATYGAVTNFWFTDNYIDRLQTEFVGTNIFVERNVISRSVNRCVAIPSLGDDAILRRIKVRNNIFIDPIDQCVSVALDQSTYVNSIFEEIDVTDNTVYLTSGGTVPSGHLFFVGAAGGTSATTWRGVRTSRNKIYDAQGLSSKAAIMYEIHSTSIRFDAAEVEDNTYTNYSGSAVSYPFYLNNIRNGSIKGNKSLNRGAGSLTNGMYVGSPESVVVTGNYSDAGTNGIFIGKADSNFPPSTGIGNISNGDNYVWGNHAPDATVPVLCLDTGTGDVFRFRDDVESVTVTSATVNVVGKHKVKLTAASGQAVTTFSGSYPGQELQIIFGDSNVTVTDGGIIVLNESPWGTANGALCLLKEASNWFETGSLMFDKYLTGSATYDPASLVDGAGATTTVTVTGAALGDFVEGVSFSLDLQGITVTAWVSSANTVSVRFQNETTGTLDLGSGTLRVRVRQL